MSVKAVVVLLALALVAAACSSDQATGPYIKGWDLEEVVCSEPTDETACYDLTLTVATDPGAEFASCLIYRIDINGKQYGEPAAKVGFTLDPGDSLTFGIALPVVSDDKFWRWQVTCDPGAPG